MPTVDGMSFRRCLSGGGDIFSKSVERQGGANRTFATGGCCHGWQLEPCPYGLEPLLTFVRKFPPGDLTPRKDVPSAVGVRPVYGSPTLRMILCQELLCVSNAVSVQRELFPITHDDFTESQLLHVSAVEDGLNGRGKEGGMIFYLGE